jgi:hypothetical protein
MTYPKWLPRATQLEYCVIIWAEGHEAYHSIIITCLVSWLRQKRARADVNGMHYRDHAKIFPHTTSGERQREGGQEEEERKAKANYACIGLLRLRPAAPCSIFCRTTYCRTRAVHLFQGFRKCSHVGFTWANITSYSYHYPVYTIVVTIQTARFNTKQLWVHSWVHFCFQNKLRLLF